MSKLGAKDLEERATGRLFFVIMEILHVRLPSSLFRTTEKNITNTLTLVPVGMHVGFEGPRHVLLY